MKKIGFFDLCSTILVAFDKDFRRHNVQSGFSKCSIFPLNRAVLLTIPLLKSYDDEHEEADVESIIQMISKSKKSRCIVFDNADVEICGRHARTKDRIL